MNATTATKETEREKSGREKRIIQESPIKVTLPQCEVSRMSNGSPSMSSECIKRKLRVVIA